MLIPDANCGAWDGMIGCGVATLRRPDSAISFG